MEYGVEIWRWSEKAELEKIKSDYIRWILGLDFSTPRYILYKETCSKKLVLTWGARAIRFEKKIVELEGDRLIKICWEEKHNENAGDLYSVEREKYYNNAGFSYMFIREQLLQNRNVENEVYKRKFDIEEQISCTKINESKYNRRYKEIVCNALSKYLHNNNGGKFMSILARVRCGNFENANKYWLGEKERLCTLCGADWGTFDHYLEECEKTIEWTENLPVKNTADLNSSFRVLAIGIS